MRARAFDAYGILFDVHSAVARHAAAIGPQAERLSELWRSRQLEYTWVLNGIGAYEDFWTLTERALDTAIALVGVPDGLRPRLLDAYADLAAYPDVSPTLRALRSAGETVILFSNATPRHAGAGAGRHRADQPGRPCRLRRPDPGLQAPARRLRATGPLAGPGGSADVPFVERLGRGRRDRLRHRHRLGQPSPRTGRVSPLRTCNDRHGPERDPAQAMSPRPAIGTKPAPVRDGFCARILLPVAPARAWGAPRGAPPNAQ